MERLGAAVVKRDEILPGEMAVAHAVEKLVTG